MKSDIDGVIIRELKPHEDQRGWLLELFRQDELSGLDWPVMAYISMTKANVARGPHEHVYQTDYFCFLGPSTFRLYLWDNRPSSPTYGNKFQIDVGANRNVAAIIPPGVVHAYKNIGAVDGIVYNAPNRLYAGVDRKETVDEIRHEDSRDSRYILDD
ncbi:MAG: dTDP-4-dehydrorhamnose 3,5-epimerase family protein [candidate division Zixibacteria bacterium]|nr:dTDP-4-dehydrorhamnose 3,5-epimerase family protein [candidate division Zixibacteria bacterium]